MNQELSAEQIQQVLQGISVPPQPQIMVDLQMEQFLPNPDLKTIAKLISQDPGLSGALLKIVNSPYFGLSNRIASIQQAVNLDHTLVSAAKLGTGAFLQLLFDAVYNAENLHGLCAAHGFLNLSAMIF